MRKLPFLERKSQIRCFQTYCLLKLISSSRVKENTCTISIDSAGVFQSILKSRTCTLTERNVRYRPVVHYIDEEIRIVELSLALQVNPSMLRDNSYLSGQVKTGHLSTASQRLLSKIFQPLSLSLSLALFSLLHIMSLGSDENLIIYLTVPRAGLEDILSSQNTYKAGVWVTARQFLPFWSYRSKN